MVVSDHAQLAGPWQNAPYNFIPGTSYAWIGFGASESSKFYGLASGYAPCTRARMAFTWQPFNCSIALVYFEIGQATPTIMYERQNPTGNMVSEALEFTGYMNTLIGTRKDVQIGFQIKGDGVTGMNLAGVRLELEYEIGGRRG